MESAKISIASHFKSFTKKLELAHNQIAISAPVINTYLAKFQCWDCLVLYSTYNCDQLCCNCESEQTQKTCRVTQGSILGPLLFNIYVCAPKTWGQWLTWINDTITDKAKKIFAKLWIQTWIVTGICTVYVLYWFTHCSFVNQLLHLLEIVSCVWVELAMVGKPYQIRYWQYYTEYILTDRNCNKTGLCCSFALTE